MSNIGYYSNMFHNLGDLTISLNNALNLLIRSYRKRVNDKERLSSKEKLLFLLSLALDDDNQNNEGWIIQLGQVLMNKIKNKDIDKKVRIIQRKLEKETQLTSLEVELLDELIAQINQEAIFAFRKMKKIV